MVAFRAPKGLPDAVPPRAEALQRVRDAMVAPLRLAMSRSASRSRRDQVANSAITETPARSNCSAWRTR